MLSVRPSSVSRHASSPRKNANGPFNSSPPLQLDSTASTLSCSKGHVSNSSPESCRPGGAPSRGIRLDTPSILLQMHDGIVVVVVVTVEVVDVSVNDVVVIVAVDVVVVVVVVSVAVVAVRVVAVAVVVLTVAVVVDCVVEVLDVAVTDVTVEVEVVSLVDVVVSVVVVTVLVVDVAVVSVNVVVVDLVVVVEWQPKPSCVPEQLPERWKFGPHTTLEHALHTNPRPVLASQAPER